MTPVADTLVAVGDTVRLTAEARDANGHVVAGAELAWASDDESVVMVDEDGVVTAVGNGTAGVTVSSGGQSASAMVTVEQEVAEVVVTPVADTLVAVGDTVRLTAEARDANGHVVAGAELAWASDDESVVMVDEDGVVTAVGNGTAGVTVSSGGQSASAMVTVEQEVAEVVVTPVADTLVAVGDTVRLTAEARDANGHVVAGAELAWASDDESVVMVDEDGVVTAVGNGTAGVTVSSGGQSASAMVTVEQEVAEVVVTPVADTLVAVGDTVRLTAEARDANGHVVAGAELAWASDDESVVMVDEDGVVTAVGNGTAGVTVSSGGQSASAMVTVEQEVAEVVVTPAADTLVAVGDTVRLTAEARDANGHLVAGTDFTWASEDEAVVTVDAGGLVTAVGPGGARVAATTAEVTGSAAVTVDQRAFEVSLSPGADTLMALGDTVRLSAEAFDANGHSVAGTDFTWASEDEAVVTVDAGGLVTAVGNGEAGVTASVGSVAGESVVTVEQRPAEVSLSPGADTLMALGDTVRLTAEAFDANGHSVAGTDFTWASEDEAVVTVDAGGLVTAVGNGEAGVTASVGSVAGESVVTVEQRPAEVSLSPGADTLMALGDTVRLSAEALDANGYVVPDTEFTWQSGDTSIVAVDSAALVTAVANGSAEVTASAGEVVGRAMMTVAQRAVEMRVWPEADTLLTEDTLQLSAEAEDANGHLLTYPEFTWSSGDESVAAVDAAGMVTGVAAGSVEMKVVEGTAGLTRTVLLFVVEPREELARVYDALGGGGWANSENWGTDAPLDEWYGVTTDGEGHITELDLSGNGLIGSIPPDLARLSHLETLDLERNTLAGSIPPEIGELHNLKALILGVNRLSGEIPAELGNLTSLEVVRLRRNSLTGPIPPELSKLHNLTRLGLDRNLLTGPLPVGFLDLERLRLLHFADNPSLCISGSADFAEWVEQLDVYVGPLCNDGDRQALASLYGATGGTDWTRSENWLGDGILHEWHGVSTDSLGRVATLDLSSNGLTGRFPVSPAALTSMTSLRIDGNAGLIGALPLSLSALPLEQFQYNDTGLCTPTDQAFGTWLAAISSHEGTDTQCSPLSDREILESLFEATGGADWTNASNWLTDAPLGEWNGVETDNDGRVIELLLSGNYLSGPIPPEIGDLDQLRNLDLASNQLTGPIPPRLGNLSNLSTLAISYNQLTGPIPSELGNLSNLRRLAIDSNQLTGPIPPELGDLSGLTHLELLENRLTGPIPSELGNLSNLSVLYLGWDGLTGPIPPELGNLTNLSFLYISWSDLTGPIPPELGNLTNLSSLYLAGNGLTGLIPPELGNLSSLANLGLEENELTGEIPSELGNLTNLSGLYLGGNRLTGTIPPELGGLAGLASLELGSNELTGQIPSELGGMSRLAFLYLDRNELAGPIPPELGNLSSVRVLSLRENQLTGSLPPELGSMAALTQLYLDNNAEMSGALPSGLTALTRLNELLLTGTDLCAPTDADFQDWLSDVQLARVRLCGAGTVSSAYLTQAVQSTAFPVPLVADRDALLRVFVTASRTTSEGIPKVRATFYSGGVETHTVDIPGSATPIPTELEDAESSLTKSANMTIPGSVIQPGLEMVIEVDPDDTLDPALGVTKRIPETGRAPVQVEAVPVLDLTLVPFLRAQDSDSSIVDIANAMAANPDTDEMLGDTRAMLPVHDLDVKAHEPVLTSTTNVSALHGETYLVRSMEGGSGYYMAIMPERVVGGESGVASVGGQVGVSAAVPFVIAHELGHNLSLYHAPCGGAGGPDRAFPQKNGSIGVWGYDPRGGGALVAPHVRDVMSYCGPPRWISDYSFAKALSHRLANESSAAAVAGASVDAPTRTVLLWGGVDEWGNPFLEPAFVADAPPSVPRAAGDYELVGRTASGDELFSLSFDMQELADADGRSFVFALPVRAEWAGALESITLSGPEGSTTMDQATDQPMAILRDPDSGQVRGILRGEDVANLIGPTAPPGGQTRTRPGVLLSRGIPDAAAWRR